MMIGIKHMLFKIILRSVKHCFQHNFFWYLPTCLIRHSIFQVMYYKFAYMFMFEHLLQAKFINRNLFRKICFLMKILSCLYGLYWTWTKNYVCWRTVFKSLIDTCDCIFLPYFDWTDLSITCSRYDWLNNGWHCADLLSLVLGSLYIDHHPSEEFSWNLMMSRVRH